ncbi:hypothetical protein [Candidatus Symbiothrix dinenymphae]|uniref:hypothetical protein n=1 Tax=Candidatus Symbiothrix dinenymphae TaxID=467085 RepID=UPI000703171C|nr:hypothetical protein [Candidatus Symbiothrix dinenymphae]
MVQLTIKPDIDQRKMNILLQMLQSWDLEVEATIAAVNSNKKYVPFSDSFGMWKDSNIDAKKLRKQASGVNKLSKI